MFNKDIAPEESNIQPEEVQETPVASTSDNADADASETTTQETRPAREDSERPERTSRPDYAQRPQRSGGPGGNRRRKKVCVFCADKNETIDYKAPLKLKKFTTERGKILPRRVSGACALHQRQLTTAIKTARHVALLSYTSE